MKKIAASLAWLSSITTVLVVMCFATLVPLPTWQKQPDPAAPGLILGAQETQITAPATTFYVETGDARPLIVANFLRRHKSPLEPYDEYGEKLVAIADKYQLDFRLLPAIAMQESNLCKVIPENSHNCLGFGIHSRGTLRFDSYEEAFETAAKTLKNKYVDIGLTTPAQIMRKYTPHSPEGAWAKSVNQWMAEMRYDDRVVGKERRGDDADLLEFVSADSADSNSLTQ